MRLIIYLLFVQCAISVQASEQEGSYSFQDYYINTFISKLTPALLKLDNKLEATDSRIKTIDTRIELIEANVQASKVVAEAIYENQDAKSIQLLSALEAIKQNLQNLIVILVVIFVCFISFAIFLGIILQRKFNSFVSLFANSKNTVLSQIDNIKTRMVKIAALIEDKAEIESSSKKVEPKLIDPVVTPSIIDREMNIAADIDMPERFSTNIQNFMRSSMNNGSEGFSVNLMKH